MIKNSRFLYGRLIKHDLIYIDTVMRCVYYTFIHTVHVPAYIPMYHLKAALMNFLYQQPIQ